MPAILVLPMAENMTTFTNFAEKVNQVSENKCKLEVSIMESKQTEKLAKMTKEMNDLKHELSQLKPKRGKRDAMKEAGRNSPKAKLTKCDSPREASRENIEPKRRAKSGESMEVRAENERINNLQRRYSCKLGDESTLQVKKPLSVKTKSQIR
jgi:hypothetical protein